MARAYAAFANGGFLVEPEFILEIRHDSGALIYSTKPPILCADCQPEIAMEEPEPVEGPLTEPEFRPLEIKPAEAEGALVPITGSRVTPIPELPDTYAKRAISPQNAYLVRSMMMDVIKRGTGRRAMELGRQDLAGKTGTTNEQRDAWFSGYNDDLVTSVWVGFDNHDPLGRIEVGGRAALPIWIEFMAVALQESEDRPPRMPEGLAQAKINPVSGLIAGLDSSDAIMEIFEVGKMPPMEVDAGGESQDVSTAEDPYENF
jgi:penicillin-binding protein 1A